MGSINSLLGKAGANVDYDNLMEQVKGVGHHNKGEIVFRNGSFGMVNNHAEGKASKNNVVTTRDQNRITNAAVFKAIVTQYCYVGGEEVLAANFSDKEKISELLQKHTNNPYVEKAFEYLLCGNDDPLSRDEMRLLHSFLQTGAKKQKWRDDSDKRNKINSDMELLKDLRDLKTGKKVVKLNAETGSVEEWITALTVKNSKGKDEDLKDSVIRALTPTVNMRAAYQRNAPKKNESRTFFFECMPDLVNACDERVLKVSPPDSENKKTAKKYLDELTDGLEKTLRAGVTKYNQTQKAGKKVKYDEVLAEMANYIAQRIRVMHPHLLSRYRRISNHNASANVLNLTDFEKRIFDRWNKPIPTLLSKNKGTLLSDADAKLLEELKTDDRYDEFMKLFDLKSEDKGFTMASDGIAEKFEDIPGGYNLKVTLLVEYPHHPEWKAMIKNKPGLFLEFVRFAFIQVEKQNRELEKKGGKRVSREGMASQIKILMSNLLQMYLKQKKEGTVSAKNLETIAGLKTWLMKCGYDFDNINNINNINNGNSIHSLDNSYREVLMKNIPVSVDGDSSDDESSVSQNKGMRSKSKGNVLEIGEKTLEIGEKEVGIEEMGDEIKISNSTGIKKKQGVKESQPRFSQGIFKPDHEELLKEIARMSYGSRLVERRKGGNGSIGLVTGRDGKPHIIKFDTKPWEFGADYSEEKLQEKVDCSNALRKLIATIVNDSKLTAAQKEKIFTSKAFDVIEVKDKFGKVVDYKPAKNVLSRKETAGIISMLGQVCKGDSAFFWREALANVNMKQYKSGSSSRFDDAKLQAEVGLLNKPSASMLARCLGITEQRARELVPIKVARTGDLTSCTYAVGKNRDIQYKVLINDKGKAYNRRDYEYCSQKLLQLRKGIGSKIFSASNPLNQLEPDELVKLARFANLLEGGVATYAMALTKSSARNDFRRFAAEHFGTMLFAAFCKAKDRDGVREIKLQTLWNELGLLPENAPKDDERGAGLKFVKALYQKAQNKGDLIVNRSRAKIKMEIVNNDEKSDRFSIGEDESDVEIKIERKRRKSTSEGSESDSDD